ncbi:MAG: NYN domain-containing protein [Bulleidia sp.]
MSKKITAGIVAHVDAGKTTCIEAMLVNSGAIRKAGRVDHRDTLLDFDEQERSHGITIYAKEAYMHWGDSEIYLIDTPGHVDFSSEMERSLSVLDLAVIMINGQDGVQAHTRTIWKCLAHYQVPCILFVNKMDISHRSEQELLEDIRKQCSDMCIAWNSEKDESLAMVNDAVMEQYLENGEIPLNMIQEAFGKRQFFPVLYGSALKNTGVKELMDLMVELTVQRQYPDTFGARVFRISSDRDGNRLTHMKITGGVLKTREKITEDEKIDQIRRYNGEKFELLQEAYGGDIVLVKGLTSVETGSGLGFEEDRKTPLLNAWMNYELVLPEGASPLVLADTCATLAAQDPQLEISTDERTGQISVSIMGKMQMEVLQKKICDLSGITVGFTTGKIVYHETIAGPVDGAGHFEPLRHYAEVHVRLEPLKRGSGIVVTSECSTDVLSASWQRSILSALQRKHHRGVLTGSFLSDVKIVLTAGKGHIKHTMGGDFRQAACRAVRQALMKSESVLLEPYYQFELIVPAESLSRALFDLENRQCTVEVAQNDDGTMCITGKGPVRTMVNYQGEVSIYTKGRGIFSCEGCGYEPCQNAREIIEASGYDPETDIHNPADSVFCANGSGYNVRWDEADEHMHIQLKSGESQSVASRSIRYRVSEDDLGYIMDMTAGRNRNPDKEKEEKIRAEKEKKRQEMKEMSKGRASAVLPVMMVVDGYNMIYAWEELKSIASEDLYGARQKLIDLLYAYQAYYGHPITIVFDGYKVADNRGTTIRKKGMDVVYTKTGETADTWMERFSYQNQNRFEVTYVTSDALIQNAVLSRNGLRMSAAALYQKLKEYSIL